ncbi:MAG: putative ABC transporter permease [Clostridia bacterium]|nr:putative ABC transporter permease [Clostridia bacterium]
MKVGEVLDRKLYHLLYYFIIYSFAGWCMETVYMSLRAGHLVNRGFLFGPFCPIYGFGALILITLLGNVGKSAVKYFIYAIILTTILELCIGIMLRSVFNNNWWDYSEEPFNIAGLICLKSSITWGIISLFFMGFVHPYIHWFISHIPVYFRKSLSYFFVLYFLIDCTATITAVTGFKLQLNQLLWIAR